MKEWSFLFSLLLFSAKEVGLATACAVIALACTALFAQLVTTRDIFLEGFKVLEVLLTMPFSWVIAAITALCLQEVFFYLYRLRVLRISINTEIAGYSVMLAADQDGDVNPELVNKLRSDWPSSLRGLRAMLFMVQPLAIASILLMYFAFWDFSTFLVAGVVLAAFLLMQLLMARRAADAGKAFNSANVARVRYLQASKDGKRGLEQRDVFDDLLDYNLAFIQRLSVIEKSKAVTTICSVLAISVAGLASLHYVGVAELLELTAEKPEMLILLILFVFQLAALAGLLATIFIMWEHISKMADTELLMCFKRSR